MDFLYGILMGLAIVAVLSLLFWQETLLRALRSRWSSRSESRLSLHEWHQLQGWESHPLCGCNPQPTSQPRMSDWPSSEATETPEATPHG